MPIPLPYSTCVRRQCVVCTVLDALVSYGASPLSSHRLEDEDCVATIAFDGRTSCASILRLDESEAAYRLSADSPDEGRMCDFGALKRAKAGHSVTAIELKSHTFSKETVAQLQAGLDVLYREFARVSATAMAQALLVTRKPVAQVKRIFQGKPGLLQESRALSFGGLMIGLDFAESGTVIRR